MDSVDAAILAKARLLILQFVKPTHVCRELGISREAIAKHLKAWERERDEVAFTIDYSTEKARQRYTTHQAINLAVDEVLEVLKHKKTLKNKRGEKVYMDMFETDAMMSTILKLDRIVPTSLPEPERPESSGASEPKIIDATYQVITNQKVLQAIKKDKSMYNMLKEAFNEQGDSRNDRHNDEQKRSESEAQGLSDRGQEQSHIRDTENGEGDRGSLLRLVAPELSVSQELRAGESAKASNEIDISTLSEGEANRVLGQRIDDSSKDRGASKREDSSSSEQRHANSSDRTSERSSDSERMATTTNTHIESPDQVDPTTSRESGAGEQYSETNAEGTFSDPFEDEFN